METDEELCKQHGVELCLFDASDWHSQGFYNHTTKVLGLDENLDPLTRHKTLLHELGHIEHNPYSYQFNAVKYEAQANRNMIHHLVKETLAHLEDARDFNYQAFMDYYGLRTTADEVMVMEEYRSLIE